jgi:hypothetical protein
MWCLCSVHFILQSQVWKCRDDSDDDDTWTNLIYLPPPRWCYIRYIAWIEITCQSSLALVFHFWCLVPGVIDTAWRSTWVSSILLPQWYPVFPLSSLGVAEHLHSVNRIRHGKQHIMTIFILIHSTNTSVEALPEVSEVRNPCPVQWHRRNQTFPISFELYLCLVRFSLFMFLRYLVTSVEPFGWRDGGRPRYTSVIMVALRTEICTRWRPNMKQEHWLFVGVPLLTPSRGAAIFYRQDQWDRVRATSPLDL